MGDLVEGIRDIVEVTGVETSDGNTAVHCHVDGVLLTELVDLVLVQASEGEHANLVGDVTPVVLVAEFGELVAETMTHFMHAAGHITKVLMPHGCELCVSENDVDNMGAVDGRVGVDWSSNLLNSAHDNILLSLAAADG